MASEISADTVALPNSDYTRSISAVAASSQVTSEPLPSNSFMTKLLSVTDELCTFMNLPIDTKVSVKNAVEYVMNYIKKNGLSSPNDRTKIQFDDALFALFNIKNKNKNENKNEKTETFISYFDIHELVYFHFIDI